MKELDISIGSLFDYFESKKIHFTLNEGVINPFNIQMKNSNNEWRKVTAFVKKEDIIHSLIFDNLKLRCGSKHLICVDNINKKCCFASSLKKGDKIEYSSSTLVENIIENKDFVYDLQIEDEDHLYKTSNGLIHHNTAITEGLAQRIAEGTVPDILKGYEIYSVDMGSLLAGTRFRGDFEERITQIVKEIQGKEKAIMFIDEIHTIIGAGSSGHSGTTDAANILKPALASGRLRVIGATTYEEYKKNIEKDAALARRFQKVDILEPSEEDTYKILQGLKESYEKFHNVKYSDDSLRSIAKLSHLYINDRFLPDKAIDVMDEVGSMFRIKNYGTEEQDHDVDEHDIEEVVSKIAKIPENTVSSNEIEKLASLSDDLKSQVFGQDEAIAQIVQAIKRSRAGFRKKDKPIANLLFAGRTGVGKTHIVRKLSEIMGVPLVRFDMSEYQEKHSVSKFVGAPAGYTGYEEGGLLVDAIRKEPHSILLLDEIEKAHPDVFNILLQVMDYATLTDNQGRKADFRNVIIVMTSNAGAHEIDSHPVGFGNTSVGREAVNNAVEKTFTPEFRNRLDKVITFNDLTSDVVKKVVLAEIKDFETLLTEKNIKLSITDKATDWFVKNGYSIEYGARPIARLIDEKIKDIFVDAVLFGSLNKGGNATIDIENDDVKVIM